MEQQYLDLVYYIMLNGAKRETRAGPTRSIFGPSLAINSLQHGVFPILTTRKLYPKGVWGELAAFIQGAEDLETFKKFGCNYWDENAAAWFGNDEVPITHHTVGRIYGAQWREFRSFTAKGDLLVRDQLTDLVRGLKTDPNSRRHMLTTLNPAELHLGCLPPCHLLAQFNVNNRKQLECIVYMRSVDLCLGLPSDIILYATLLILLAKECGYTPGQLTFMMGDAHIYESHLTAFKMQLAETTRHQPQWLLSEDVDLFGFEPRMIKLINYNVEKVIKYDFHV